MRTYKAIVTTPVWEGNGEDTMNTQAMVEHLKFGFMILSIAILTFGCRTSIDRERNQSVENDPVVGEWQEIESLANANFLHPASVDVDASVKCNPDGSLVIHEGDESATLYWHREDNGRAVVTFAPMANAENRSIVIILKIEGNELVVSNQMGGARFRRIE